MVESESLEQKRQLLEGWMRQTTEAVEAWIREPKVLERFQQQIRGWSQRKVEMEQEDKDHAAKLAAYGLQNWNSEAAWWKSHEAAYFLWIHPDGVRRFRLLVPEDLTAKERLGEDANQNVLPPTEGKPLSLREQYVALAAIHDSRIDDSHRKFRIDPWKDDASCRERRDYGCEIYNWSHIQNDSRVRTAVETVEEANRIKEIKSAFNTALEMVAADIASRLEAERSAAQAVVVVELTLPVVAPHTSAQPASDAEEADVEREQAANRRKKSVSKRNALDTVPKIRKKRDLDKHANECVRRFKDFVKDGNRQSMKYVVQEYCSENSGVSISGTYQRCSDHSYKWKK